METSAITERALDLVREERHRQNSLWGDQSGNHPFEWMSILGEEYGELCEAVNETYFQNAAHSNRGGIEKIIKEATHVAAVAVTIIEASLTAPQRQAQAEKEKPLTLDELWQAQKQWEPVWAVSVDGTDIFPRRWSVPCVLDCTIAYGCGETKSIVAIYGKNLTLSESDYGRTWLAYRRKPEEEKQRL